MNSFFALAPWWVKISTLSPYCVYYFGPFDSFDEAEREREGYLEDLENEGARGISIAIGRARPDRLTVDDATEERYSPILPHARTFSRSLS